ncbi:MAG: futalosine hydrolase [Chitinophagaceae bacterium]|nr:futalosine hydrolase [Chitinophagaceae bacterium]MBK7122601.1 futalosine hydrolase [Chitinophagaceae bacterium]MBK9531342.1 futalosine hydrolase [Chitinophagaceae bacterium]
MKGKHEICCMQILVIAATELEIEPFTAVHKNIDVLITGVGVPAAIYHLLKRMHQIDYDLVIQAGIAGSFDDTLQPGQTVLVRKDCFADLGFEEKEKYTPVFETGFADKNEFPFENGWLNNTGSILTNAGLPLVNGITVNKVSDNALQKQQFVKQFNPGIETMEGAALHYVCLQENIPFLQIRSISNYVGERDKIKWKLKEAIENLNIDLIKLINRLTN